MVENACIYTCICESFFTKCSFSFKISLKMYAYFLNVLFWNKSMEKKQLFKYTACKKVNNHNNFWKKIIVFNLDVAIIIKLLFIFFSNKKDKFHDLKHNFMAAEPICNKISKSKISSDVTCILCQITTSNLKQSNISIVENVYYFDSHRKFFCIKCDFQNWLMLVRAFI